MCLGIPGRVLSISEGDLRLARVEFGGIVKEVCLAYVPDAEVGDDVTLIGEGIRVEDLARKAGTIPYEVTCRLGRRVGRIPANAEQPLPAAFRVVA